MSLRTVARRLMHGKVSPVYHYGSLFLAPSSKDVHSLIEEPLPELAGDGFTKKES
jgi:hypothetical protein